MANDHHLTILDQGVEAWNRWRTDNPGIRPNLRRAKLADRNLAGVDLSYADLHFAQLTSVDLTEANLNGANLLKANLGSTPLKHGEDELIPTNLTNATLREAKLHDANLVRAQFVRADLTGARLWWVNALGTNFFGATLSAAEIHQASLHYAKFNEANLVGAHLSGSSMMDTDFEGATLEGCNVYGISAWDLNLKGATQANLVITRPSADDTQPTVTVDNLEVAQFMYLLINNEGIRQVIDTVTSKVVLILGRFTEERKVVLDALRGELRQRDYAPVLFDFERPSSRDLTETVSTIAHMARFVIADITDAKSIPQELSHIVPNLPSVPVQPLLEASASEYGMFEHFERYPWVLESFRYKSLEHLLDNLAQQVIIPAEAKAKELRNMR